MLARQRQLLERLLPIYEPDIVVLGYVMNDAEPSTASGHGAPARW